MRLTLFRRSPLERLLMGWSEGAEEAVGKWSTDIKARSNAPRQDDSGSSDRTDGSSSVQGSFPSGSRSTSASQGNLNAGSAAPSSGQQAPDTGSGASSPGQETSGIASGSTSGQAASNGNAPSSPTLQSGGVQGDGRPVPVVASAPADSVPEGLPTENTPEPTQAAKQTQAAEPSQVVQTSQAVESNQAAQPTKVVEQTQAAPAPPATPSSAPEAAAPSTTVVIDPTTLPTDIATSSDVTTSEPTATEIPAPVSTTSGPVVDAPTATTSTPEVIPLAAAATTGTIDQATFSTSTTEPIIVATTPTADLAAAQTSTSSSIDIVAQTSTADAVAAATSTTKSLPPAAAQTPAIQDTTANDLTTSTTSTTSIPPPDVTSLPPALAPFTNAGVATSLPPALASFPNTGISTFTPAANTPVPQPFTDISALSDTLPESSGAAISPQKNRPSTFVTSIKPTQIADNLPSGAVAGGAVGEDSDSGSTGNVGPGGTGGNDVNGANGNGISATKADHSAMNKMTQAVGFTFLAIGSLALIAGIIYLVRRMLRQRRLGKAYSPPSSPLLNAINDPLPSGIQRSISERSAMGTGRSEFWSTSDSNTMIGPVGTRTYQPYMSEAPATYRNDNGTYRSELSTNTGGNDGGGGGVMGAFRIRTSMNRSPPGLDGIEPRDWDLDSKEGWDEKVDASPLSPLPQVATLAGERGRMESVRVDGMRFEMIGEPKTFEMPGNETFKPNEKPLGGGSRPLTGGVGQN